MSLVKLDDERVHLHGDDCREVLKGLDDNSIDSVVCDPPYALVSIQKRFGKDGSAPTKDGDVYARSSAGFMGKQWDTGETAFAVEFWQQVFRVLKPGGHVVAFSGTRTYHRMACAIEDAGFEIRDQLAWTYGSGFPKSHDISKAIDKKAGAVRDVVSRGASGKNSLMGGLSGTEGESGHEITEPKTDDAKKWAGYGTALKPCWEPICLARKAVEGTIAENVLKYGPGALNIDGCRVGDEDEGRWPTNIMHDGSDEVISCFPDSNGQLGSISGNEENTTGQNGIWGSYGKRPASSPRVETNKSASRFFYCAKASSADREEGLDEFIAKTVDDGRTSPVDNPYLRGDTSRLNTHPTVKPTELMRWLCRLITPPGGTILDPFMGSGSTGKAAVIEEYQFIGCEREEEYIPISQARIEWAIKHRDAIRNGYNPSKDKPANDSQTSLFEAA